MAGNENEIALATLADRMAVRTASPYEGLLSRLSSNRPGGVAGDALRENRNVPFVQRILDPDAYPARLNPDYPNSSHLMADGEVDGRYYAYPTLRLIEGQLVEDRSAITAVASGNAIEFGTPQEAFEFARGSWKKAMNEIAPLR